MAILLNPECRDDNHAKCPNAGLDDDAGTMTYCPCHCHEENPRCGKPHEATGLSYLGPCLMGPDHDGPHHFVGPIAGTVISVTISGPEDDPGAVKVLEDLGRAMGKARERDQ
jgi:hypothetical protein